MKKQMTMTMGRKMKNDLNSMKEYYYGFGRGRYGEVLDELRVHGRVNSCRTSSIPLAEFWQPDNLKTIEAKLRPFLEGLQLEKALKYFEFPTDPIVDGTRIGRPSMTDLMILDGAYQIAIEAKYTEYSRMPNETVAEAMTRRDIAYFLRRRVVRCWLRYIREAGCTDLGDSKCLPESVGDVSYQFLHRTASACHKTDFRTGLRPVLVYQLFFDADDAQSIRDCAVFKAELRTWAEELQLRNMKFLVMSVPVVNAAEVMERHDGCREGIFEEMKFRTIYKFDFDAVEVENAIAPSPGHEGDLQHE